MADWDSFFPPGTHVLALPNWKNPRLYLPAQHVFERWGGSSSYPAYRLRARLYRILLRVRAATRLTTVRMVPSDSWALGEFLGDVLPQVTPAMLLVGTQGPAQKLIVQLQDKGGRIVGYLKYAEKPMARRRLRQECQMISGIPAGVGPEVLKHGTLGDGEAILTTLLPGKVLRATLPPTRDLTGLLMSLAVLPPMPLESHPWVSYMREQSGQEVDTWLAALTERRWPVVVQHGDFAPWNLIRSPDGRVGAVDWEYGTLEGFPCLDLAHYVLQVSALIYRRRPSEAARYTASYLASQAQYALSETEARALTCLAAYDAHLKFCEDGQSPNTRLQGWRQEVWKGMSCSV